jgi:hypothetical protein
MMASTGVLVGAALTLGVIAAQPAWAGSSLVIRDFVMTHGIYEREPVGSTESFTIDDNQAYAFARINNEGEPTRVSFIWQYGNETHAKVDMNIGTSSGWRTWSSTNLSPGSWRVQVVSQDGAILAERSFTVDNPIDQSSSTTTSNDGMDQDGAMAPQSHPDAPSYGGATGRTDG